MNETNFDDELREIMGEMAKPGSPPTGTKGQISAIPTPRRGAEKLNSGHPRTLDLGKKGENGGFAGLREKNRSLPVEGSKPLLNTKHEEFAHLMAAGGKSQWQAYMEVYQCSRESAEDSAWRLMAEPDNFGIIRRFTFIREQISAGKVLTAREAREYLASAVRTPLSEIDEHSCLAQEVTYEETEKGTRTKIKSVNRLEALKLDADLGGYALHASQEKTPMRLRLIASSSGDAASIAAEIDGI